MFPFLRNAWNAWHLHHARLYEEVQCDDGRFLITANPQSSLSNAKEEGNGWVVRPLVLKVLYVICFLKVPLPCLGSMAAAV